MRGPPGSGYPVRPMLVPGQSSHHPALGIPLHMGKFTYSQGPSAVMKTQVKLRFVKRTTTVDLLIL